MQPLLFNLNGAEAVADALRARLNAVDGACTLRRFPDGETYLRIDSDVKNRSVILLCGLEQPDQRLLPALFFAETAREFGAQSIGLVTPYLPYMRQDKRFRPGEALTSRSFAALLSRTFDWLVTVDPHLHRYHELGEIYSIPSRVVAAAPALAAALESTSRCFLLGPDAESEQWVAAIGRAAGIPWKVASKQRRGDRDVKITLPDMDAVKGLLPIIVDDVISSGTTIRQAAALLQQQDFAAPLCVCVHALFADNADEKLQQSGIAGIRSCNTIGHVSNAIDIGPLLADATAELLPGK